MILYIGFDGAYVFSNKPLHKHDADKAYPFLAPRTGKCFDVQSDGDAVLRGLRLKKFDVIKVTVRPMARKKRRSK